MSAPAIFLKQQARNFTLKKKRLSLSIIVRGLFLLVSAPAIKKLKFLLTLTSKQVNYLLKTLLIERGKMRSSMRRKLFELPLYYRKVCFVERGFLKYPINK